METLNHLEESLELKYVKAEEVRPLLQLNRRALKATTGLLKYLLSCKGKAPTGWDFDEEHTGQGPNPRRRRKRPGDTPDADDTGR